MPPRGKRGNKGKRGVFLPSPPLSPYSKGRGRGRGGNTTTRGKGR